MRKEEESSKNNKFSFLIKRLYMENLRVQTKMMIIIIKNLSTCSTTLVTVFVIAEKLLSL